MRSLVLITWHDSRQPTSSWQHLPMEEPSPVVVHTVGWLLHHDKDVTVIASSIGDPETDDEQATSIMQIATRSIVKTKVLKA